jgi:hypothetical protein
VSGNAREKTVHIYFKNGKPGSAIYFTILLITFERTFTMEVVPQGAALATNHGAMTEI